MLPPTRGIGQMRSVLILGLLVVTLFPGPSSAAVFKCIAEDGVVTFSDKPCGQNAAIAFPEYVMSVDDAAALDIVGPFTNRKDIHSLRRDIEAHAAKIGSCILPHETRNFLFADRAGGHPYNRDIDWKITLLYGPPRYEREWRIDVYYKGRMNEEINVWLQTITVAKDGRPFSPPSMRDLKRLKQTGTGAWTLTGQ